MWEVYPIKIPMDNSMHEKLTKTQRGKYTDVQIMILNSPVLKRQLNTEKASTYTLQNIVFLYRFLHQPEVIYIHPELEVQLVEVHKDLPTGHIESFDQLLANQAIWIRDLVELYDLPWTRRNRYNN